MCSNSSAVHELLWPAWHSKMFLHYVNKLRREISPVLRCLSHCNTTFSALEKCLFLEILGSQIFHSYSFCTLLTCTERANFTPIAKFSSEYNLLGRSLPASQNFPSVLPIAAHVLVCQWRVHCKTYQYVLQSTCPPIRELVDISDVLQEL